MWDPQRYTAHLKRFFFWRELSPGDVSVAEAVWKCCNKGFIVLQRRQKLRQGAGSMAFISEDRVDLLEEKLRSKIDTMTGFSDVEGKSRALEKVRDSFKACTSMYKYRSALLRWQGDSKTLFTHLRLRKNIGRGS